MNRASRTQLVHAAQRYATLALHDLTAGLKRVEALSPLDCEGAYSAARFLSAAAKRAEYAATYLGKLGDRLGPPRPRGADDTAWAATTHLDTVAPEGEAKEPV